VATDDDSDVNTETMQLTAGLSRPGSSVETTATVTVTVSAGCSVLLLCCTQSGTAT
jgi:hypothetical protein